MQIRSRIVARGFNSEDRPDLYAWLEALKALISITANNKDIFLNHTHRHVTCMQSCKSSGTCAGTITSGGQNGRRRWKIGWLKNNMYGTRDAASNWERDWQDLVKKLAISAGTQLEESVSS